MATETQEVLIKVTIDHAETVKRSAELKSALDSAKSALSEMKKAGDTSSEMYVKQEAAIKQLTLQYNANQRVVSSMKDGLNDAAGAYAALNQKSAEANQRAKDLAAAYGANDQRTKEAQATALGYTNQLKEIDKAIGQNQRSVGDYGIAVQKLPGIFGEMQASGQSVLVSLRTKFESVKDATMSVRDAMAQSREAMAAAMQASEKAAIAEQALKDAEEAGAATSALAAEAEAARATATTTATVATELGSKAMQIFKVALISTGIGALVVALGAVVAYFTKTNDGSKQFAKISAGINAVLQSGIKILGSYGKLLFAIATFDLKKIKEGWTEIGTNIKNATGEIVNNYKAGVQNTANQQEMAKRERTWSGERLLLLKQYEEARFNAGKKSKLDDEGKIESAKKALKINEQIFQNDLKIAKNKAIMIENEQKLVSKKDYQAIQDAKNKVQEIINAHSMQQITVDALLGKAEAREAASNEAGVKSYQSAIDKKEAKRIKADQEKKAAEEKAEKEELDRLKKGADDSIKLIDDVAKMAKLKEDEKNAAVKLSNQQAHAQKLADIDAQNAVELEKQTVLFGMKQITEQQFNAAVKLANQEKNTAIAQENAAFDEAQRQLKNEAALIDFQNKYDTAVLNNENMAALEAEQLENKYQAEILAAEKTGADTTLIDAKYSAMKQDLAKKELDAKLSLASGFAGNVATIFGKNTKVGKAAASAQIAIDTYKGAMAAFASFQSLGPVGIPLGIAAAAAVAVQGAKSIKDVWAVKSGLPGDGGGGGTTSVNAAVTASNVTGSLVSRTSSETNQQSQQTAVSNALQANPTTPVLVVDNVTDAQANKANVKVENSL